jgi:hypothetical protein
MSEYAAAILIDQNSAEALQGLAWILSTSADPQYRNGAQAAGMAERACQLTGRRNPDGLKTLAAAYAEAGRFDEAAKTAEELAALAKAATNAPLEALSGEMTRQFRNRKPWRE